MGFTYTDANKKVVLHSWGRFKGTLLEAVATGDLLNFYATDNAYTLQFADQSDSQAAQCVACEDGAVGDEIWVALAAELKAPTTIATGGVATQTNFAAAADFFGSPLYLGESGKPASSAGATYSQLVGYLLARDRIILQPNTALTGVAGSFTTLASSGATTMTATTDASSSTAAAVAVTGGLAVAKKLHIGTDFTMNKGTFTNTEGDAVLTKGDLTLTAGAATLTKGDLTLTAGNITLTAGVVNNVRKTSKTATATLTDAEQGYVEVSPAADTTLTLPTAAAGKYFLIKHLATTNAVIVVPGTSDKLLDPADGVAKDKATDDKGLDCVIELRAVDAVNWLVLHQDGDWTYA